MWVLDMMSVMKTVIVYFCHFDRLAGRNAHVHDTVGQLHKDFMRCCWLRRDVFTDGNPLERVFPGIAQQLRVHLRLIMYYYLLLTR